MSQLWRVQRFCFTCILCCIPLGSCIWVAASLETKYGLTRKPWEHKTLLNDYRSCFCNLSFFFNRRHATSFDELMQMRYTADYEDAQLDQRDADDAFGIAEEIGRIAREVFSQ